MLLSPNFTRLFFAYAVSQVGDVSLRLIFPILIYNTTHDAILTASVYSFLLLPFIVIMPIGGVIGDIISRKKILIIGDFLNTVVLMVSFILLAFELLTPLFIFILSVVFGSVAALYQPAFFGLLPSLVSKEQMAKANSYIQVLTGVINLGFPGIIGLLLITLPHTLILACLVGVYSLSLALLFALPKSDNHSQQPLNNLYPNKIVNNLWLGVLTVIQQPVLLWSNILFSFTNAGVGLLTGNLVYMLMKNFELQEQATGFIIALASVGGIAGSFVAPYAMRNILPGVFMTYSMGIAALGGLIIALFPHSLLAFSLGRLIVTFGLALIPVCMFTYRAKIVPQHLLSRTMALMRTWSFISTPMGAFLGGFLLQHYSIEVTFWVCLGLFILPFIIAFFTPFTKPQSHEIIPQ